MTATARPEAAAEPSAEPAAVGVLEQLLEDRFTCRAFTDQQVEPAVIERLLGLAQRTPSWCNTQPWQVVVTSGEATTRFRDALLAHMAGLSLDSDIPFPATYAGVYQERRRECGAQLYEAVGIGRGDAEARMVQMAKNFEFFGAPHTAIITTEADLGPYGAIDCGLYTQTFLLAAQALGLGAAPQAALAMASPFIREYFDIPDHRQVVVGISFGHADHAAPVNGFRTSRADLGVVLDHRVG